MKFTLFVKKRENDFLFCIKNAEGVYGFFEAESITDEILVSETENFKFKYGIARNLNRSEMEVVFKKPVAVTKNTLGKSKLELTKEVIESMELV
jgi:hypothetical protein